MSAKGPRLSLVVAATASGRGIGRDGQLPWRLGNELKWFKALTTGGCGAAQQNAVIMGRKTWESIPAKFRPLPGRLNIVLSSRAGLELPGGVVLAGSLDDALERLRGLGAGVGRVFVIGGGSVYHEALGRSECDSVYLTQVYASAAELGCDAFLPDLGAQFRCRGTPAEAPAGRQREGDLEYEFFLYERERDREQQLEREPGPASDGAASPNPAASSPVASAGPARGASSSSSSSCSSAGLASGAFPSRRHEEHQYLDMIRHVLEHGVHKGDRTGTGTLSTFGTTMRFSLQDGVLPLLTTKKVFWRGVAEELLWFISGDTNAKTLMDKGIHIWDGNGSRAFLDKLGLTQREEFDLGPVYGFQWRHFGAEYKTMRDDYSGQGVDQLKQLVHKLKTDPNDRRMVLSAWNPAAFHLMALPPCHMFAQFYVANGELSCQMYQRSADMGLGVPFNIASYALLTRLLAQCAGLQPGEFIHVIGDCHVYKDHVEPLKEQLTREPLPFPTLKINSSCTDIDGFKFGDFELVGYQSHKAIAMKMSV
jgi:dihydrofolate reductase/thymidylate synthase